MMTCMFFLLFCFAIAIRATRDGKRIAEQIFEPDLDSFQSIASNFSSHRADLQTLLLTADAPSTPDVRILKCTEYISNVLIQHNSFISFSAVYSTARSFTCLDFSARTIEPDLDSFQSIASNFSPHRAGLTCLDFSARTI